MIRAAIIAALLAGPAIAQTSTTACRNQFGQVVCDTQQQQAHGINMGTVHLNTPAENALIAQQHQASVASFTRQRVGKLIADGRCEDARKAALRAGDLDLAEKVPNLCRPS